MLIFVYHKIRVIREADDSISFSEAFKQLIMNTRTVPGHVIDGISALEELDGRTENDSPEERTENDSPAEEDNFTSHPSKYDDVSAISPGLGMISAGSRETSSGFNVYEHQQGTGLSGLLRKSSIIRKPSSNNQSGSGVSNISSLPSAGVSYEAHSASGISSTGLSMVKDDDDVEQ